MNLEPRGRSRTALLRPFLWLCLLASLPVLIGSALGFWDIQIRGLPFDFSKTQFGIMACASFLMAVSVIALFQDREWGRNGFIASILIAFAGLIFTGAPAPQSAILLLLPVWLLLLDSWSEQGTTLQDVLEKHLAQGLKKEPTNLRDALNIYTQLKKLNQEVDPWIFLAGMLGMPGAFLLADWIAQRLTRNQGIVVVAIICMLGLGPLYLLWARRYFQIKSRSVSADVKRTNDYDPKWLTKSWSLIFVLPIILFGDLLQLAVIAIITVLVIIVLILPYNLYQHYLNGTPIFVRPPILHSVYYDIFFGILLVIVSLIIASDFRLKPFSIIRIVKEIPIGLRLNVDKVFSFFSNNVTNLLLANILAARYTILYNDRFVGALLFLFTGATLGWELCKTETNPYIGTLNQMGISRCLFGLGRKLEADFELYVRMRDTGRRQRDAIKYPGYILMEIISEKPNATFVQAWLADSESALDSNEVLPTFCEDNFKIIRSMLKKNVH